CSLVPACAWSPGAPAPDMGYVLKSSAATAQTVPSSRALRQARARVVRPWPAGSDQTKPQMSCPGDPQPYGSGFRRDVNGHFRGHVFCSLISDLTPVRRVTIPNALPRTMIGTGSWRV